ncbi:MAG: hypothetical protein M1822_003856 [Bathelium mastoideum]|nr:MAG: hypothetical protein M1822_003856 [Bathelium mastoideum]
MARADIVRDFSEAAPGEMKMNIERLLSISIRVMFMMNCGADQGASDLLETARFIDDAFAISDHPSVNEESPSSSSLKNSLRARKLKKHAGLRFIPTNDVREHLKLDYRTGIVQIFHLTSFVKEQLRATKELGSDASVEDCVKHGALPRQLLLEIIDSIQRVLFPISDPKSYALLESLTGTVPGTFDPDCLRFESDDELRKAYEKETKYFYFGSRLMDLHRELQDPTPRGFFGQWLERRSGARYAMLATIIASRYPLIKLGLPTSNGSIQFKTKSVPKNRIV